MKALHVVASSLPGLWDSEQYINFDTGEAFIVRSMGMSPRSVYQIVPACDLAPGSDKYNAVLAALDAFNGVIPDNRMFDQPEGNNMRAIDTHLMGLVNQYIEAEGRMATIRHMVANNAAKYLAESRGISLATGNEQFLSLVNTVACGTRPVVTRIDKVALAA